MQLSLPNGKRQKTACMSLFDASGSGFKLPPEVMLVLFYQADPTWWVKFYMSTGVIERNPVVLTLLLEYQSHLVAPEALFN